MKEFKSFARIIGRHFGVLVKGFVRMLFGTATAGLIVFGSWGLCMIPGQGGYAAVFDFVLALTTLMLAVYGLYVMGGINKKGAKR